MKPAASRSILATAVLGLAALLFASQLAVAHDYKLGDLSIDHPFSRATPPAAKVAVGYLTIRNASSAPDRLVAATAEISETAELHEMAVTDGVMTMRPIEGLEIPAGGEAKLESGSQHLMFVGLKRPLKQGEKFAATLTFEKAGAISVEFAVEAMGGGHDHGG